MRVFEYDCLSHATIVEFLKPSIWVVLMYAYRETGAKILGRNRCEVSA